MCVLLSGKNPTSEYLDGMMNEAPGPINFTMFLTLFGERLQGTDPEDVIKNAFGCFDEENSGHINEERLRELLTSMGDRFTDEEVRKLQICRISIGHNMFTVAGR
jgi:myosin regulatory light chain 12